MNKIIPIIFVVVLIVVLFPRHSDAAGDFDPAEYDYVEKEGNRRECILRFNPSIAYITKYGSNNEPFLDRFGVKKQLKRFDYIHFNMDLDIQIYRNWFATGSFIYSHAFYKTPLRGGVDMFGVPFGIKYVLLERDYQSDGDQGRNRL